MYMTSPITFPNLGIAVDPSPVAFTVFGKDVYWYGLIIAIGFVLAVIYMMARAPQFGIMYGTGISHSGDVLDLAANEDIVQKSGSWYNYNGERLGQGRNNTKALLEKNPGLMREIENKVREKFGFAPIDGDDDFGPEGQDSLL